MSEEAKTATYQNFPFLKDAWVIESLNFMGRRRSRLSSLTWGVETEALMVRKTRKNVVIAVVRIIHTEFLVNGGVVGVCCNISLNMYYSSNEHMAI